MHSPTFTHIFMYRVSFQFTLPWELLLALNFECNIVLLLKLILKLWFTVMLLHNWGPSLCFYCYSWVVC